MNGTTIEKYDDNSIYIVSASGEDFLKTIVEKAKEGYTIADGTVMLNMYVKRCAMNNPTVKATKQEPVQPSTKQSTTYSQAVIGSFKGDKNKLEQYGKEFGIELKKSKAFDNMVKDLEDHVGFPVKD